MITAGTWVQIERTILKPEERPDSLPPETRVCPYVLRVNGFLLKDSAIGNSVTVQTLAGRDETGILIAGAPEYGHSFGRPVQELLEVRRELSALRREEGRS